MNRIIFRTPAGEKYRFLRSECLAQVRGKVYRKDVSPAI